MPKTVHTGVPSAARSCVFCGRTGDMSKEHLLRRKFIDLYEPPRDLRYIRQDPLGKDFRRMPVSQFQVTINDVCRACNGGWLNDLENAVEPFLNRLIMGEPANISEHRVDHELGLWMVTRALLRSKLDPANAHAPIELFREMFETRRAPKGTVALIGITEADVLSAGYYSYAIYPDGYTGLVTFTIGRLFFQVGMALGEVEHRPAAIARNEMRHFSEQLHFVVPYDRVLKEIHVLTETDVRALGGWLSALHGYPVLSQKDIDG